LAKQCGFDEAAPISSKAPYKDIVKNIELAVDFVKRQDGTKPFFLYVPTFATHGPQEVTAEEVAAMMQRHPDSDRHTAEIMVTIAKFDECLGRLFAALDERKLMDSTLVCFASDNGAYSLERYSELNKPLREGKGSLHEGGIRVPLMIRWPGKVPAGTTTEAIVHAYDFYPTLLDLLGLKKTPAQTFDGISFAKILSDPSAKLPERPIFIAAQNGCCVRLGDWKLYRDYKEPAFALYNLKDDLSETTDLAAKHPEKVKELETILMSHFAATTGVPRQLKKGLNP
jgi:arylsulfatase A-like enzyme